jgi:hypothetical protein
MQQGDGLKSIALFSLGILVTSRRQCSENCHVLKGVRKPGDLG